MNEATIVATLLTALLAGSRAWAAAQADPAPVTTRINLSDVIAEPTRRKTIVARFNGRLARELRGGPRPRRNSISSSDSSEAGWSARCSSNAARPRANTSKRPYWTT